MHLINPSRGYKAFMVANHLFFILLAFACIFPILHVLALSLSTSTAVGKGLVFIFPVDFTLASYQYTLAKPEIFLTFMTSVRRTVVGTALTMFLTITAAYPLSRERYQFRYRNIYVWFFVITMLFSGGLIPWYINIRNLKLTDTIWALILPGAVSAWSVIILMNFMRGLPREMEESAFIDGAGYWRTLWAIFVPLCVPCIATLVLFVSVGHWNSWFDGIILMNSTANYPLQSYLQTILFRPSLANITREEAVKLSMLSDKTLKGAQIFIATLPILAVYPFLQKYFVTGLVLGSVKG